MNTPNKTPSTPFQSWNVLRETCEFVFPFFIVSVLSQGEYLSQIYALFWRTIFPFFGQTKSGPYWAISKNGQAVSDQVSDLSRCAEFFQTSRVLISGGISIFCRWGGEWTPVTGSCQWSTEEKGRVCKDYHDTRYSWGVYFMTITSYTILLEVLGPSKFRLLDGGPSGRLWEDHLGE